MLKINPLASIAKSKNYFCAKATIVAKNWKNCEDMQRNLALVFSTAMFGIFENEQFWQKSVSSQQ